MRQGTLALGGLAPFSTVDFPGRLAAVLFTQGCPLRCRYCHNTHLRRRAPANLLDWQATTEWLRKRQGLLDAVVISGGEPTVQPGLPGALAEIQALGFETGLHTAGTNAKRLAKALPYLNWVGFDFKAPFGRYEGTTGLAGSGKPAEAALNKLTASKVGYEIRTTVHPRLLDAVDLLEMARELQKRNVRNWVLQTFRADGCQDKALVDTPRPAWLTAAVALLQDFVPGIVVR
jgi:anaerobic ribonucleoside-triphosphate reductase activating protein